MQTTSGGDTAAEGCIAVERGSSHTAKRIRQIREDTQALVEERDTQKWNCVYFVIVAMCLVANVIVAFASNLVFFRFRGGTAAKAPTLEELPAPWDVVTELSLLKTPPLARRFEKREDLWKDRGWYDYIDAVYSADTVDFPLSTVSFSFFYYTLLNASFGEDATTVVPHGQNACSVPFLHLYNLNIFDRDFGARDLWRNMYFSSGNHACEMRVGPRPFASHQLVEVMHQKENENFAMWHYYSPGSGIFLDIGRTVVFRSHEDASASGFDMHLGHALGYDTVQFLRAENFEIVDLRMKGDSSCPPPHLAHLFRSGWKGRLPCSCDPTQVRINCV